MPPVTWASCLPSKYITTALLTAVLACLTARVNAATPDVPRWQPHDFSFTAKTDSPNPFQVPFSADVTGPDGKKFTTLGFYDGENTWKIRISPTALGNWSLVTHSPVPELNDQHASFVCIANPSPQIHGPLRIDPEHPQQFIFEDGTHTFPMGYECDWLWALDTNDTDLKTINPFLDRLTGLGFNLIILNAYAQDTSWRKGRTGEDDFGPPPLYAWEGTNDKPDQTRFNLAYWQHYDRVIEALHRRGIVAHILMKVYNKQVKWPVTGSPEDDLYFRWLIARYAAYPNVTWDLSKEAQYEKSVDYKIGRFNFIRANDPYHRLLTIHDDKAAYDRGAYDNAVDYRSDQQHTKWRETMLAHLQKHAWPVINTEFGYEHGPKGLKDKTYSVAQGPEEVCRRAWELCTAGGFVVYYYTYTAWDVIRLQDNPPGYAYFKNLSDFFNHTHYWQMKPTEGLVSEGSCLADPGHEYIVFLNAPAPFTLKIEGASVPLHAEWYHPFTAEKIDAGTLEQRHRLAHAPTSMEQSPHRPARRHRALSIGEIAAE